MNQEKLSIRFVISISKINKRGLCPITCRLTYKKKRKAFSTGLFVNPKDWNAKKQFVLSKEDKGDYLNSKLSLITQKANNAFLSLQLHQSDFSVDDIFDKYINKKIKKEDNVVSYFRRYLKSQSKLIGKDIKQVTWNKLQYVCNDAEAFIKKKYNKSDYPLNKLELQFIIGFEYYLKTEKNQKQITINKAIQRFRKPIRVAVSEGYLDKDPFQLYKPGRVKNEVVFLQQEELTKLENYQFGQPRLNLVKDLFIFCCYTGLAYKEMSNLKKEHLIKGFDGNVWIQMKREKTSKMVSVPLLPRAHKIIDKYNSENEYVLPKLSNQKVNSYLKEIAEIVGLHKKLTHHTARKTFASTVLLYNDVPIEIVSELLGHSSISITEGYYGKVVQKKVSEEISRLCKRIK